MEFKSKNNYNLKEVKEFLPFFDEMLKILP